MPEYIQKGFSIRELHCSQTNVSFHKRGGVPCWFHSLFCGHAKRSPKGRQLVTSSSVPGEIEQECVHIYGKLAKGERVRD